MADVNSARKDAYTDIFVAKSIKSGIVFGTWGISGRKEDFPRSGRDQFCRE